MHKDAGGQVCEHKHSTVSTRTRKLVSTKQGQWHPLLRLTTLMLAKNSLKCDKGHGHENSCGNGGCRMRLTLNTKTMQYFGWKYDAHNAKRIHARFPEFS